MKIFGGFTDIPWSLNSVHGKGMLNKHNSFLFRLNDDETIELLPNKKEVPFETQHGDTLLPSFWDDL